MTELGEVPLSGFSNNLFVQNQTVFIADDDQELLILNITNPANPQKVVSYDDEKGKANDIMCWNNIVFIAGGLEGLELINITNLAEPQKISNFDEGGIANGVFVNGTHAFVLDLGDG